MSDRTATISCVAASFYDPLTPGAGFSGATPQPDPVGNPEALGYDAKPGARFDAMPYDLVEDVLCVVVDCDHINAEGIDFVRFTLEGGTPRDVELAVFNETTGVTGYPCFIDPADLEDGRIELRAVVYPVNGTPRVMPSLILYANSDGTYDATTMNRRYVATVQQGNGNGLTAGNAMGDIATALYDMNGSAVPDAARIKLLAGTHTYTAGAFPKSTIANSGPWLTIEPDDGLTKDDVTLQLASGAQGIGSLTRLRFHDLHLKLISGLPTDNTADATCLVDDCEVDGTDKSISGNGLGGSQGWPGGVYVRGGSQHDVTNGGGDYIVGCAFSKMLAGGPWYRQTVINCTFSDISKYVTGVNLTVDGTTNTDVLPDGIPVRAGHVGWTVVITNGGGWTGGTYTVNSIQAGKWRLSSSPAATGTTGGIWSYDTTAHSDLWRTTSDVADIFLSGLTTPDVELQPNSNGIVFFSRLSEGNPLYQVTGAIVKNCVIAAGSGTGPAFAMGGVCRNVLIKNNTFIGLTSAGGGVGLTDVDETVVFDGNTGIAAETFPGATFR